LLNQQLISTTITTLAPLQTVQEALDAMDDLDIHQLPVVEEGIYKGLLDEADLLSANSKQIIQELVYDYHPLSVKAEDHILNAVKLLTSHQLNIIPVVDNNKNYLGSIDVNNLIRQHAKISGAEDLGGLIVLEIDRQQYNFGEISKLVETNDALITQLNTYTETTTGIMTITIRINKIEVSDVIATFQRYGYHIAYFFGKEDYENEIKHNYDHLMNYINI
jgi:acetoin utilization protein AcuB